VKPILLVFLKYPEAGRVKTRLAEEIGADAAARLYREWIGIVLRNVQALRRELLIVGYIDGATPESFCEWSALVDEWRPQSAGGLGERLAAGFEWGFLRGGPVLAIGTDCLEVSASEVRQALQELEAADAAFGPATDGGYYLVGTRRHISGFFNGVRWSSPHTLWITWIAARSSACAWRSCRNSRTSTRSTTGKPIVGGANANENDRRRSDSQRSGGPAELSSISPASNSTARSIGRRGRRIDG
jgi:rSAM/selenodomain-associated transferase 1